tara:strand:- start:35 stop:223 length:189 start_codon:yes stop_codon:yes gene_type:complete
MKKKVLDKIIDLIREEGPVMSMGNGGIAGSTEAGDDPPVKKRKRYIWTRGIRKNWKPKNESK